MSSSNLLAQNENDEPDEEEEIAELSPFEVVTSTDQGYLASNTLPQSVLAEP